MIFGQDFIKTLPLSTRFAWRELRGGIRGFRIFLICLIMGVAISLRSAAFLTRLKPALPVIAQKLLGGDISLRLNP